MTSSLSDELKRVVESQHGGQASHVETVQIIIPHRAPADWDGYVYTFALTGHPTSSKAYGWALPMPGNTKRYFAVLHSAKVKSPVAAVEAAVKLVRDINRANKIAQRTEEQKVRPARACGQIA